MATKARPRIGPTTGLTLRPRRVKGKIPSVRMPTKRAGAVKAEAEGSISWTDASEDHSSIDENMDRVEDTEAGGEAHVDKVPDEDPLKYVEEVLESGAGELCELHTYDSRKDSKGDRVLLRTGMMTEFTPFEDKSMEAAMTLTRYFTATKEIYAKTLTIRSPYIKRALKEVVKSYPGVNIGSTEQVYFMDKPKCLFHYRDELRQYAMASNEPQTKAHILLCLDYMARVLRDELLAYHGMMDIESGAPGLEFQNLWMVYKPGTLAYGKFDGIERVYKLVNASLEEEDNGEKYWNLVLEKIDCNGTDFGRVTLYFTVSEYEGHKAIKELKVFPLEFHEERQRIREELISRGRKFVSLFGVHYRMYTASAEMCPLRPYGEFLPPSKDELKTLDVSCTNSKRS